MTIFTRVVISVASIAAATLAQAQTPDNTKQNAVDQTNRTVSADAQKNDSADLALTQQIRASVMADKSLSTYAHNVKIVSINGNVTLNGPVHSQQEKESIEAKAHAAVNGGTVVNNLKVTP